MSGFQHSGRGPWRENLFRRVVMGSLVVVGGVLLFPLTLAVLGFIVVAHFFGVPEAVPPVAEGQ